MEHLDQSEQVAKSLATAFQNLVKSPSTRACMIAFYCIAFLFSLAPKSSAWVRLGELGGTFSSQPVPPPVQHCIMADCSPDGTYPVTFWYPGYDCNITCTLLRDGLCYDLLQGTCTHFTCPPSGGYWSYNYDGKYIGCTKNVGPSYTHPCPNATCNPYSN